MLKVILKYIEIMMSCKNADVISKTGDFEIQKFWQFEISSDLLYEIKLNPSIFGGAASLHKGLPVRLSARLFQLASGEVLLTILTSNIVGEYCRAFYNYPGPKT